MKLNEKQIEDCLKFIKKEKMMSLRPALKGERQKFFPQFAMITGISTFGDIELEQVIQEKLKRRHKIEKAKTKLERERMSILKNHWVDIFEPFKEKIICKTPVVRKAEEPVDCNTELNIKEFLFGRFLIENIVPKEIIDKAHCCIDLTTDDGLTKFKNAYIRFLETDNERRGNQGDDLERKNTWILVCSYCGTTYRGKLRLKL